MTTLGYFIVTDRLKSKIEKEGFSGYEFGKAKTSKSQEYKLSLARRPREFPPVCHWLKVTGKAGTDDFGIYEKTTLVVSDKVLAVLKSAAIEHCEVEEF